MAKKRKKILAKKPCQECGTKQEVTLAPDPYNSDLYGDETPVWMCEDCRLQRADDI